MRFPLLLPPPLLLAVLATVACTTTTPRTTPLPAAHEPPLALRWIETSAEYPALVRQTYRRAGERLEELAVGRTPGTWAVVVDADETLLSNVGYQWEMFRRGKVWDQEAWDAWAHRAEAEALPGARTYLERVRQLGGIVAVITNRDENVCDSTRLNLERQELPFDVVLCRRNGESDKSGRWNSVRAGTAREGLPPAEVLMWVGDNIHDFPDLHQEAHRDTPEALNGFGDHWFLLPNPMYGSWTRNTVPAELLGGD